MISRPTPGTMESNKQEAQIESINCIKRQI
jgi:hypothetical protein